MHSNWQRIRTFAYRHWLAIGLWLLIGVPVVSFLSVSALITLYVFWPNNYSEINPETYTTDRENLVLLAHGLQGDTRLWIDPTIEHYRNNGFAGQVVTVNWKVYAQKPISCAVNGKRIGHRIGAAITQSSNLEQVHLVGHSCGAFVVYGACLAIKAARPELQVRTTYLAPVSIYGIFKNYGRTHFGSCGDTSVGFVDSTDTITGSIHQLSHGNTIDLAASRQTLAADVSPHNWPALYFQQQVREGNFTPD